MSLFLEYHLIQNFAPSNLNRDDTGAPKDALFGGHRRARVSSQCFKRAVRLASGGLELLPQANRAVRTKKLRDLLLGQLQHRNADEAKTKIEIALASAKLKIKDDGKTEYLLFLGDGEVSALATLIDQNWDELTTSGPDKKSKKDAKAAVAPEIGKKVATLMNGGKAVDVALFGRMLADLPQVNQDAACQVAHAISTHRVEREFDYFTAVDDKGDEDESGAGMIGQVEFNSATFYRYAVLDLRKLLSNLQGDRDLALSAVHAFTLALARAVPSGKQNSFAAHNPPEFVGVCLRHAAPMNLANAFERPVASRRDESLSAQSIRELAAYEARLSAVYGSAADTWLTLDLSGQWPLGRGSAQPTLQALAQAVQAHAAHVLPAQGD